MFHKFMAWVVQATFVLGIALSLTVAFVPEGFTQERASTQERAKIKPMRVKIANKEIMMFCAGQKVASSTRGNTTTYSCGGGGTAAGTTIQTNPGVSLSKLKCDYSMDGEGNTTWNGCSCGADGDSDCTDFITNCAKAGDEVGGNSGSATCSPSDG